MGDIRNRFERLDGTRTPHLERQRKCAALTLPALLPPIGQDENVQLETPWQSLGARGVNNLASKLLLILLPASGSFFRLTPAPHIEDEIRERKASGEDVNQTQLETALAVVERKVNKFIEQSRIRVPLFRALKLLIVTGNALCYLPKEGGMKIYRLDQYVLQRDKVGNIVEVCTKEEVAPITLSPSILEKLELNKEDMEKSVAIYTKIKRTQTKWEVTQEINGVDIEESYGTYAFDSCPWIVLRWSDSDGGHYGRGLVDENLGDLISLENLTKTIVEGSAAMAKMLFLVDPNGVTNYKSLAETPNTGFAPGRVQDVACLQADKRADFQVAQNTRQELLERLSMAFLMNSAVQRQAERVTAEEIRFMANELEDALGGVYSLLSQEFQIPLVNRMMAVMRSKGDLPSLPKGSIEPVIVTGIDALGRGHDLNKMNAFMQNIGILGPEQIAKYMVVGDYIARVATSLCIDTEGLIRSEEEVQQQEQQMMMQQAMSKMGTDTVNQLAGAAGKMATNEHAADLPQPGAQPPPQQ
jgi:hypothetical protein